MQLNVKKCKSMHVSRKHSLISYSYSLHSLPIELVQSYRYLGVTITSKLTWSEHIHNLVAATNKSLGFIRRSLSSSPPVIRKLAYDTFIRTKLEFASAIWHPHQAYLVDLLEAVQNRAARFITSQYDHRLSVTNIKSSLDIKSLALRRKISRLCLFHKLYYNFPHLRNLLLFPPNRTSCRLSNSLSIQRIHGSTNSFNNSFLPLAIAEWNSLPDLVVTQHDPIKFRNVLIY